MSNDLISRKAVIQAVDRHTTEEGKLDEDISVILEEIPTAYDVDAVCKELEIRTDDLQKYWTETYDEGSGGAAEAYYRAIEIVRNGGKRK